MASLREESDSEESSYSSSLSDNENFVPRKKKRGRKAQWQDSHVADMVLHIMLHCQPSSSLSVNNFMQNKKRPLSILVRLIRFWGAGMAQW